MRLIDHYLPSYQFRERHTLVVSVSPNALMDAVLQPGTTEDPWARRFTQLRELPDRLFGLAGVRSGLLHRPAFGVDEFMPLGRDGERELALGLIGRFWRADYGLVRLPHAPERFKDFVEPGIAKLVLNFSTQALPNGRTLLATETRVQCVDRAALRRFTPYWWLIRPVSGLIRRRLLARVRDAAMAASSVAMR